MGAYSRTFEMIVVQALQGAGIDICLEELIQSCGLSLDNELESALEVQNKLEKYDLKLNPSLVSGGLRTGRVLSRASGSKYGDVKKLLEDIDESSTFELKSSMVLDVDRKNATGEAHRSEAVIHSLLKTICGFANAQGGTLIVGVDDDKNVVGIEGDFSCGIKNIDQWQLQLSSFIKGKFLNGDRVEHYVDVDIQRIDGVHVAIIYVVARNDLTFLTSKDKKTYVYYYRSGNKTERIDIESFEEHILRKRGYI